LLIRPVLAIGAGKAKDILQDSGELDVCDPSRNSAFDEIEAQP
jgi:hypothetical protein